MNDVRIVTARRALPAFCRTTEEILPYVDAWLGEEPERLRRKALKIFEGAGVDRRYGIMDLPEVFTPGSFEEKNRSYAAGAKELGKQAINNSLKASGWSPESLDILITVSCTGIMIPSLDAYLINDLGLRGDIIRLPVTEMGCVAGVSGLIYANRFLKAGGARRAAVLAVESPAATFQHTDHSMANIISAAIFGDGASCVLLSNEEDATGPRIVSEGMYHFPGTTHLMGFDLTNHGLKMVLDPEVPEAIAGNFQKLLGPFLESAGYGKADLRHLVFHPGGRKIVETVESLFREQAANIDKTREVLRRYGNMSSATVLYVLQAFMEDPDLEPGLALMLSFGPGFTAQRVLLSFDK
ncbi:type III polyketide synthase [Robiginitalea sp. SC105]|uniref:type III polyketide synthase n=1 Tax=Robiginitalea sp. SC105 TaxID=2762332 RepID=UPI00163A6374|nr:type III polyketide synthase [Robiginitalea sp. SC105]MBC2840518.1 type III polyketide synthase [Robiginitalea sp. SC105]